MDQKQVEQLGLAMVSAYVWIASADDGVDVSEFQKFQKVIVESPFATHFSMNNMKHWFHDMVTAFETDYEKGVKMSRDRIRVFAENPNVAEEIHRIVRAAMVADAKLKEVEETVLVEIKKELKI
jgi:tellurite resistance protein